MTLSLRFAFLISAAYCFSRFAVASDGCAAACTADGVVIGLVGTPVRLTVIDQRTGEDYGPAKYIVAVQARESELLKGNVGHAWVSWARYDERLGRPAVEKSFGYWPHEDYSKLAFLYVPGRVIEESADREKLELHRKVTHAMVFLVDEEAYVRTGRRPERFMAATPHYQIVESSCKKLAAEVLADLGVGGVTADTARFPHQMIEEAVKLIPGPPPPRRGVVYSQGF